MSDAVFQSGTVLKRDVTAFIRDAFINAGWQQVSTDLVNDGYIFYSTGEDGNKETYIRMRATGTSRFDASDTGYEIDFWTLKGYVPNPGGSGTGTMTIGTAFTAAMVMGVSNLTFNTTAQYFIHTNRDRMILFLEWPSSLGDYKTHVLYLGSATTFYPETQGQSNTIMASNLYSSTWNNLIYLQNNNLNTLNTYQTMSWYYTLANTNPDREGKLYFSELYFGDTLEGYRGKIEDIYLLPTANVIWKDEIVVDTQRYRIMVPQVYGSPWYNSFPPSPYMAIRIA
jgi:hypothetical protein